MAMQENDTSLHAFSADKKSPLHLFWRRGDFCVIQIPFSVRKLHGSLYQESSSFCPGLSMLVFSIVFFLP